MLNSWSMAVPLLTLPWFTPSSPLIGHWYVFTGRTRCFPVSTHVGVSQDMNRAWMWEGWRLCGIELCHSKAMVSHLEKWLMLGLRCFQLSLLPYPFILIFRYSLLLLNCATETVLVIFLEIGWENGSSFNRKLALCLEIDSISEQTPVKCAGRAGTGVRAWEHTAVVVGEMCSPWAGSVVKPGRRCWWGQWQCHC